MEDTIRKLQKYRYNPSNNKNNDYTSLLDRFSSLTVKDIKEHNFGNSTSCFNNEDIKILSVVIEEVRRLDLFLKYSTIPVNMDKKNNLNDFASKAGEYECRRFDLELERVIKNNKSYS